MPVTCTDDRPVVVGYDGSPDSVAALRLAAVDAATSRSPLEVVAVADLTARPGSRSSTPSPRQHEFLGDARAAALLDGARTLITATGVRLHVDTVLTHDGDVASSLLQRASSARLLAVGAMGSGHEYGSAWGEVAVAVTSEAPVPVLVARGATDVHGVGLARTPRVLVVVTDGPFDDVVLDTGLDVARRFAGRPHVLRLTAPGSPGVEDGTCRLSAVSVDGEQLTSHVFTGADDALRRAVARADVVVTRADGRAVLNGLLPSAPWQGLIARLARHVIAVPAGIDLRVVPRTSAALA